MRVPYSSRGKATAGMAKYIRGCAEKDPDRLSEGYLSLMNRNGASVHQATAFDVYEQDRLQAAAGFPFRHIPGKDRGKTGYKSKDGHKVRMDPFSVTPADQENPVKEVSDDELTG